MNEQERIMNLMQFARKAGKLINGCDATVRAVNRNQVYLVIISNDTSAKTKKMVEFELSKPDIKTPSISFGMQHEFGIALGLPDTGIFGVIDKNFADKMLEYWSEKK